MLHQLYLSQFSFSMLYVFFFFFSLLSPFFIARLYFMLLHHHTVSLCYLFSSCVSCSPSCGSLVQFLCSRILSSFLKLYFVFRFILHLFPKSCSAGPKLLAWIITHSFPPSVSTTCFRYFAFPYQQFIFPQISTSVLSQPFSSIQHLVLFLS